MFMADKTNSSGKDAPTTPTTTSPLASIDKPTPVQTPVTKTEDRKTSTKGGK